MSGEFDGEFNGEFNSEFDGESCPICWQEHGIDIDSKILNEGFEDEVRLRLGVDEDILTNNELRSRFVYRAAERKIIKRAPDHKLITDENELMFLELAVILQIAVDICPSIPSRFNVEESTLDIKWKKGRINWEEKLLNLLSQLEGALSHITSVSVLRGQDAPLISRITYPRDPMGGT